MRDAIKNLKGRIEQTFDRIQTEEATKAAYIMPFIQILGYDVFNPLEVVPEFTADVGIKKGEKVDYAIMKDDKPSILIECKDCRNELNVCNESQLFRYFHTTGAKFGILTNGIVYKFFTDLKEPNKMDEVPFLQVSLLEPDKINYTELAKFSKASFDVDNIRRTADLLKCSSSIRKILNAEFDNPSEDLVRLIFRKMDCGGSIFNDKAKEKITPLVKAALDAMINDKVKANLDIALQSTEKAQEMTNQAHQAVSNADVTTTQEEIDAFNIVRAIAAELSCTDRVYIRDAKTYCALLFDDNNRRPVCRLHFNNPDRKAIALLDKDVEDRQPIQTLDQIYTFKDRIVSTIKKYLDANVPNNDGQQAIDR